MLNFTVAFFSCTILVACGQVVVAQETQEEQKEYSLDEVKKLLKGTWTIDRKATREHLGESDMPDSAIPDIGFHMLDDTRMTGYEGEKQASGTYSLEKTDKPNEFSFESKVGNDSKVFLLRILNQDQILITPEEMPGLVFSREKKK